MSKIKIGLVTSFISLFSFQFGLAQFNILVSPETIQESARPGDVLEYKIKIKNLESFLYHFYTQVEDIGEKETKDKKTSLANWIEIFRGRVEIKEGEEKEIPLSIKIPSFAQPGNYFAQVIFAQGSTEIDAKERAKKLNFPKLLVSINVKKNVVEKIQVKKFQTEKNFHFGKEIKFKIELSNIGNEETLARGKILIYDKRGKEIENLQLEIGKILPGETKNYELMWKTNRIGQLKGVLFGEYGENWSKVFQDTTFFWVFNWKFLVYFFLSVLILIFFVVLIFSKILKRKYFEIFRPKRIVDIIKR